MFTTVAVKRISVGSVYKLFAVGLAFGMVPLGLFFGVLAFFGANTVTWNGRHLTGIAGLFGGPLIGVFLSLLFTALVGSLCAFGLWLYSLLRPLQISYKQSSQMTDAL
jgi:hypothetical protein